MAAQFLQDVDQSGPGEGSYRGGVKTSTVSGGP